MAGKAKEPKREKKKAPKFSLKKKRQLKRMSKDDYGDHDYR